jgi:serine/threonine-protein kinase RsbW
MSDPINSTSDFSLKNATTVVIPSDASEARRVQEEIEEKLRAHQYGSREIFSIRLALEEALVNAIKHGNQMDRSKSVHITYRLTGERFDVVISDQGCGFDPADVPDPTAAENLERPCGRGLMLMRHYMHEVAYSKQGNAVSMTKFRRP